MEIKGGRFLIAGGFSLIGSHIADELLTAGAAKVVLFDNGAVGSATTVEHLRADSRVAFVAGDILNAGQVYDALAGIDGVFHTAYFITIPLAQNLWAGMDVNVRGLMTVLDACRWRGVKKLIYASSIAAYGNSAARDVREEDAFNGHGMQPIPGLYATGKLMAEYLCAHYGKQYGLAYNALRISTVYGARQHARGLNVLPILQAYDQIKAGQRPVMELDPAEVHDYIYAADVARAQVAAMAAPVSGEIFTIASGNPTTFDTLIRTVMTVCAAAGEPIFRDNAARMKSAAATTNRFNIEKARRVLGWSPAVGLEEGIRRLIAWHEGRNQPS